MDSVREMAVMLSVSSVAVAFITFLVPDGAIKKTVNTVVTLFFMCICIIPVFGDGNFEMDLSSLPIDDLPRESDYIADADKFYLQSGELLIKNQIDVILGDTCSYDYSFDVKLSADADRNIVLDEITVTISQNDSVKMAKIITEIGSLTGIKPKVEVK